MNDFQAKYLTEVSHRLQREGFSVEAEDAGPYCLLKKIPSGSATSICTAA